MIPLAAQLSFASPALLWGLAGVLLPIAAHLWLRRLSPAIRWPSVRLLLEADPSRTGRAWWRDALLLTSRCLVIGLIAVAFAQPLPTRSETAPPLPTGSVRRVVLVLDGSASMQRHERGLSLFDRAKADVMMRRQMLTSRGDDVTVMLAATPTRLVTNDALAALKPTDQRVDLAAALRDVSQWSDVAEVELFSDMQATGLASFTWPAGAPPLIAHCYGDDAANMALCEPGLSPRKPVSGQQTALIFSVANHSDAKRDVTVRFSGDLSMQPMTVRVAARSAAEMRVPIGSVAEKIVRITAEIPADALMRDNRLTWTITPARPRRVAVIGPMQETAYLRRAIEIEGSGWTVVPSAQTELAVTVGDETSQLPGILFAQTAIPGADGESKLTLTNPGRRPWRVFGVTGVEQLQQRIFVRTNRPLRIGTSDRVLAVWSDDGQPAVVFDTVRRQVRTNISLVSPAESWGESWRRSPLFLPVLQEWLKLADGEAADDERTHPGQWADWPVDENVPTGARLVGPDGKPTQCVVRRDADGRTHVQAKIDEAGTYRLTSDDGRDIAGWCVTVDRRESDLRQTDDIAAGDDVVVVTGNSAESPREISGPTAWWPMVLAGAMVWLMIESAMAWKRHVHSAEESA